MISGQPGDTGHRRHWGHSATTDHVSVSDSLLWPTIVWALSETWRYGHNFVYLSQEIVLRLCPIGGAGCVM